MINCVVFDLDGTLVNSHETIFKATLKTLEKLGLNTSVDKTKFYSLLGHHFKDIFDECGIEVPDLEFFISNYKTVYFEYINDSQLYDNTLDVLKELKKMKIKTGLLTTKGHDQAVKIASYFGLNIFLDSIEGRKNGVAIKPSPAQLIKICRENEVDPENALMVGDTDLDIKCGKAARARTCAVTFGYREVEELISNKPDYIIDDLKEILKIISDNEKSITLKSE